jgi:hypothetical protein
MPRLVFRQVYRVVSPAYTASALRDFDEQQKT